MNDLYNPSVQGVSVYSFNSSKLNGLVKWLTNANGLGDLIDRFYNNPTSYIRGIKIYPFKNVYLPDSYLTKITTNNVTLKYFPDNSNTAEDFYANRVRGYSKTVTLNYVPRYYNDFRDYEPYTTCRLYIPFLGEIPVTCNDVYEGLKLKVLCDLASGSALFRLTREFDDVILVQRTARVGFNVNVGGTDNYSTALENLSTWASYLSAGAINLEDAGGVKTSMPTIEGGWAGVLSKGINFGAKSIANTLTNGMSTEYTAILASDAEAEFYADMDIIMYIKRNDTVRADNAQHYDGYPTLKTGKLKNFRGYTVVNDVHTYISSTSDEQEQVYNLLQSGVIL